MFYLRVADINILATHWHGVSGKGENPLFGKTFDYIVLLLAGRRVVVICLLPAGNAAMESLLILTFVVTLAEIGDKTQLLAFVLATRFKRPVPIILGILLATLLNHGIAGSLGAFLTALLSPQVLRWVLAASFLGMAAWALIPDKIDDVDSKEAKSSWGIFGVTFVSFFLAEMGDKTQIATVALAAHYSAPIWVIAGTTLGMLIADVPAVFIGQKLSHKIPMKLMHRIAALVFAVLGVMSAVDAIRLSGS